MFDISRDKTTQDILRDATAYHADLVKMRIEWSEVFRIFPKTCYLSGQSTGWFKTVWRGRETCDLHEMLKPPRHLHGMFYARPDQYIIAILKDDPKLLDNDA